MLNKEEGLSCDLKPHSGDAGPLECWDVRENGVCERNVDVLTYPLKGGAHICFTDASDISVKCLCAAS